MEWVGLQLSIIEHQIQIYKSQQLFPSSCDQNHLNFVKSEEPIDTPVLKQLYFVVKWFNL